MNAIENTECEATGSVLIKNAQPGEKHTTVSGIYGLRNKVTNKWYIGQSRDIHGRWDRYYKNLQCKKQRKLFNALCKYGYDNFEKIVLEKCGEPEWILDYREMYWIKYYNSFLDGYNLTEGGKYSIMTADTKKKIGDSKRGKKLGPMTKDHIANRTKAQRGMKRTDAFIEKLKSANTGKKHSTESKLKMSNHIKTEDHRNKISSSLRGRKLSDEHKNAVRVALEKRKLMGLPVGRAAQKLFTV